MRQKSDHALHRGHRDARFWPYRGERHDVLRLVTRDQSHAPAAQDRTAFSELHAFPQPHGRAKRCSGHRQGCATRRTRSDRERGAGPLRRDRVPQALSGAALRWAAAARGVGAHARGAAGHPHARRAVLRAGFPPEGHARAESR